MGKFVITEEEKKQIKSLYEQDFSSSMQDLGNTMGQQITQSNIQNRFGQELYDKTESLAKKMGMTLMNNINDDNSFYMWGKNITNDDKLVLLLANENNNKPITAYLSTWVDRDNGKSSVVKSGRRQEYYPQGGMGTYPSFDTILSVNNKFFDQIEPEMNRISKMFQ